MGSPGGADDDDHLVTVDDNLDEEEEEEDPEEEEFEEDPEEEEEEEVEELEEHEELEEVEEDEEEEVEEEEEDEPEEIVEEEEEDELEKEETGEENNEKAGESEHAVEEYDELEDEVGAGSNEEAEESENEVEEVYELEDEEVEAENNEEAGGSENEVEEDYELEQDEIEAGNNEEAGESENAVEEYDELEDDEVGMVNDEEAGESESEAQEDDALEEDEVGVGNNEEAGESDNEVEEDDEMEEDEVGVRNDEEAGESDNEVEEEDELDEVGVRNDEEAGESDNEVEEDDELEEDEVKGNNEEAGESDNEVGEEDKPSILPVASEEDATDRLRGEKHVVIKADTDAPRNETEERTECIEPLIFTKRESLRDETVDAAYKGEGADATGSDCGKTETSQFVNEKEANNIECCAVSADSKSFEAAEPLVTNPSISVEPGAVKYDKVDCGSEGNGVKEMQSDGERESCQQFENKDAEDTDVCAHHSEPRGIETTKCLSSNHSISMESRSLRNEEVNHASKCKEEKRMESDCEETEMHINKKVAECLDVYDPSSESKGHPEIVEPLCTMGLDSGLVLMQDEGGVVDMELDSEENTVHESDVNGTVVDSIQGNIALNSHLEVSFNTGADAPVNNTVVGGSLISSSSRWNDTMHSHVLKQHETKNMNLDLKEHITPKPSSVPATLGNQRSLPPVTQITDRNKRRAIICSYYAKGWCIKGNSCRFLHSKENEDNTSKPQETDLALANGENQVGEGVGDSTKTMFPEHHAGSQIRQLNNKFGYSSLESRFLHSAKPEFGCGAVAPSSAFANRLGPPNVNATTLIFNDPLKSIADRYINQHLHPSAATEVYSSRYISPINGCLNPIISLNSNPFIANKIVPGSKDSNASASSFGLRAQGDRLNSLGLAPKAEMHKWEPSKPFRPSYIFFIPSASSPGSMYDPLRDSFEHTSSGSGSFRAEPIHYPPAYPDSASEGNHFDLDVGNGTALDRYGHSRVTGLPVTEAEAAESSVADQGNLGSALGGDKGSGTSHSKGLSGTNKANTVSAEKKRKAIEEKIHDNGVYVDRGLTDDDQRESKTYRQFRAALIEFTKELLKPAWRVGNLSKDAHNLIVKKAVTKVLSSIHSLQVPSTPESVQQYLSASQPKISKLLEAYVQKHSKT